MKWPSVKIIRGCEGRGDADNPYLTRVTFAKSERGACCLHVFHRSDADDLHDHPWGFCTLILWRGYVEVTPQGRRRLWPLTWHYRSAQWRHRVELLGGKRAVTLVWRGPYVREWGFFTSAGWVHWREYFERMGC